MESSNTYLLRFEEAVVKGIKSGLLGRRKMVPAYPGKLAKRKIGRTLGGEIDSEDVVVIDYYGYMKKSRGFSRMLDEVRGDNAGKQLKMIEAPTVHFNSVRLEVIAKIDADLVAGFGDFKKLVLDAREFNHNYRV